MNTDILNTARNLLEEYEKSLNTKPLAYKLSEGLDLLDEALITNNKNKTIANNIANTYINKTIEFASRSLEDKSISELELEKLNDILIEAKESSFGDKDKIQAIRNKVLAGLIKYYFRGYTPEEQKNILDNVLNIDT